MTTDGVVFDTWAWWEVVFNTEIGIGLTKRYLGKVPIHTSAWALGELAVKVKPLTSQERVDQTIARVRSAGEVHDVTAELAMEGARLRPILRNQSPRASLGDGVMLATARSLGLKLVSGDAAFKGQQDVVR